MNRLLLLVLRPIEGESAVLILSPYDHTVLDSIAMCANLPGIERISLVLRENEQRFEWTWERPRRRRSKRAA